MVHRDSCIFRAVALTAGTVRWKGLVFSFETRTFPNRVIAETLFYITVIFNFPGFYVLSIESTKSLSIQIFDFILTESVYQLLWPQFSLSLKPFKER